MRYVEKQHRAPGARSRLWREHLVTLDHLRQVIGWRGHRPAVDPLNEYKREAFQLFDELIAELRGMTTAQLNHVQIGYEQPPEGEAPPMQGGEFEPINGNGNGNHDELAQLISRLGTSSDVLPTNGAAVLEPDGDTQTMPRASDEEQAAWGRVSRNAPCPCGSGKKYKHCHGALNS